MRSLPLAALAAVAAVAVSTAPAGAAPAAPAPALPAGTVDSLVQALRSDLGLTPEQFLAQAGVGERLSRAAQDWSARYGQAFGGVWLDRAGTGVVGVTRGAAPGAAALRDAARRGGFTIRDVALTSDELSARERQVQQIVAAQPDAIRSLVLGVRVDPTRNAVVVVTRGGTEAQIGTLTAALKGLAVVDATEAPSPAGDTAPFGSQGGAPAGGPTTHGLDPATGGTAPGAQASPLGSLAALAALAPEGPARTALEQLATGSGAGAATGGATGGGAGQPATPVPPAERPARLPVPAGPVPGGTAYEVPVRGGVLACSTGFNGELDGKPVVITAAHCAGAEGTRAAFPDAGEFGTMRAVRRDGVDTALIAVDEPQSARFRAGLVGTGTDTTQPISGTARPVVGQKACKMGSRTGFSCGTVAETGTDIDVAGTRTISNGFTIDLCALPGDSGGVVFSGDKALGISSASNVAEAPSCRVATETARKNGYTPRLSAVPIDDVLAAHPGLRLRTDA